MLVCKLVCMFTTEAVETCFGAWRQIASVLEHEHISVSYYTHIIHIYMYIYIYIYMHFRMVVTVRTWPHNLTPAIAKLGLPARQDLGVEETQERTRL